MNLYLSIRLFLLIIITGFTFIISSVYASNEQDLKQLNQKIKYSKTHASKLIKKTKTLAKQRQNIQKEMIKLAYKTKKLEARISMITLELGRLKQKRSLFINDLQSERQNIAYILSTLQNVKKNLPPALVIKPEDSLAGLRTMLILTTLIPHLQEKSNKLKQKIDQIDSINTKITQEQNIKNKLKLETLKNQKLLATLADKKQTTEIATLKTIQKEQTKIKIMQKQAKSLNELLETLKKIHIKSPSNPSIYFSKAKGTLPLPIHGIFLPKKQTKQLNLKTGREGEYIQYTQDSIITAPYNATIIYAGEFHDYGNMIIMSTGQNYHLLLSGIHIMQVKTGQTVLAGEPIGQTHLHPFGGSPQTLYVEMRHKGNFINTKTWFKKL